jgi:protocatechuate 3,4-dioxygenase, alpha subunit
MTDETVRLPTTPSQTVGPFFGFALPYEHGPFLVDADTPGAFRLWGRVLDGAGDPVTDALVEIWQADADGDLGPRSGVFGRPAPGVFRGFGRCETDDGGGYAFRTVRPGAVPLTDGTTQAPHIAMSVYARGMLRNVVTRVYFPDEVAANASDPLLNAVEPERRETMVARREGDDYRFDVHIQGDEETVFLDVFER